MTRRTAAVSALVVSAAAVAVAAVPAGADLQLGGSVPSLVAVAIGPASKLERTAQRGVYALRVAVRISSTLTDTRLSIADGEDPAGSAHGHLRIGPRVAPGSLRVEAGGRPQQLLSAPTDPVLETFAAPVSAARVTVTLLAPLSAPAAASKRLHKLIWITISGPTP
jgi:hypothetical protein